MKGVESLWSSKDSRFLVQMEATVWQQVIALCNLSVRQETGGILVGFYENDGFVAHVAQALEPPTDSHAGQTWFMRGVRGVDHFLYQLWRTHQQYYLGEWHYHPSATSSPSSRDHDQMYAIANDSYYACPEPLLWIIGGDQREKMNSHVFVYPQGLPSLLIPAKQASSDFHCMS